jgi:hypothetical protein
LGHQFDRGNRVGEIAFQRNTEACVLRAGTVIGEVQCFLDQAVEIDTPTFAAAAMRMLQHALNDVGKICPKPLIFYRASRP